MADSDELIELFGLAHALPAAERPAFLDARCAGSPALRAELESLLAHAESSADFLEAPHPELAHLGEHPPEPVVGPYHLVERLGEGGFGEVWRGEQREPISRTVAVKLIRPGIGSSGALARFGAERQALALLEHPGIARIHDAGATPSGQPWYAMELVDGPSITTYCTRRRLGLADRVRLLVQVCDALHHAHERGIVHRDLKPSNVLVAEIDGRPQPKIIDFGIAKLQEPDHDAAWRTHDGQVVGTPAYMSPEQARGDVDAVDARTDVHALGVLLFELLTGTLPFEPGGASARGILALQRRICEDDAPRPSSRIAERGGDTDYRQPVLPRAVRGDLDWIVLKALAKGRSARYSTARALADDLERFLNDRPVLATPQHRLYRARKWVARHRAVATAGAVAIVLGGVGAFGTLRNLSRAERSEAGVRAESAKLGAVALFLQRLLANADPERTPGREVTIREVLDQAERQLVAGIAPEVETALRHTIGMSYRGLGRPVEAERNLRLALQLADRVEAPESGAIRRELGLLFVDAGRLTEAEALLGEAMTLARERGDGVEIAIATDCRGLLQTQRAEYPAAVASFEAAIAQARDTSADAGVLTAMHVHLADAFERVGRYADAERALADARERALAEGDSGLPLLLQVESGRVRMLLRHAEPEQALRMAEDCVRLAERIYGAEHFEVGFYRCDYAEVLQENDRLVDAEAEFRAGIELLRRARPGGSISESRALGNLGWTLSRLKRNDDAEAAMREGLAMRRRLLGADHPDVASGLRDLAKVLRARGAYPEAEQACREALAITRAKQGDTHLNTAITLHALGLALIAQGRVAEAVPHLEETLRIAEPILPPGHAHLAEFRLRLGHAYLATGRPQDARPLFEGCYAAMLAAHGPEHRRTVACVHAMIELAEQLGDADLAATWRARLPPEGTRSK